MNNTIEASKLKNDFEDYLGHIYKKNLTLIIGIAIAVLLYYSYSDWIVRRDIMGLYTRIPSLAILSLILLIHLFFRNNVCQLKKVLYILGYLSLQLMMYARVLIHLHDSALAPSVTGTVLVIFLISLDIKLSIRTTSLIYSIPIILFSVALYTIGKPSSNEFLVLADIYPIAFVGFAINRIQYQLRFKLFRANYLLKCEEAKTKVLYENSLVSNSELKKRADEALIIKEEIQKKNDELNKSNATKDRFLGIIAHDLKNPIGAIWGLSDVLLADQTIEEKERHTYLKTINSCIKNIHNLLDDLLIWARAQSKNIVFEPQMLSAKLAVDKELQVLMQAAAKKEISIKNKVPEYLKIYADEKMLETIIRNLVSNAIKYTRKNGEVVVNAVVLGGDKNGIEISIADTGVGMDSEKLNMLFTVHKDISTRGTDSEEGTGLGLLLCKEFMDAHKGDIGVESILQKGSVFRCFFPDKLE
nr:HAMP domain-containing sensor histidine kinase [uncultured Carboxylicivirga sp.]